ncbi:MAG: leucyl aminopeptidase family protein [bacterium]|nr:leucyl aminopeptidase family protein [bacterium]
MKFILTKGLNKAVLKKVDALLVPIWLPNPPAGGKPPMPGEVFAGLAMSDRTFLKNWLKVREIKVGEFSVLKLVSGNFVIIAAETAWNEKKFTILVRKVIRCAKQNSFKSVGIYVDDFTRDNISESRAAALVAENALLSHFDFAEEFKTKPKGGWKRVESVTIFTLADVKRVSEAMRSSEIIGEATNRSRVLSNFPPGDMKPEGLVEAAKTVVREMPSITLTVFDEKRLKAEGMNAILAVGQGSIAPPRLIIMEYRGADPKEKPIALVGKGVTFDSGGLNIKPGDSMADMHMDMSGASAVISAMWAIAKLKLPVNVVALAPAVENMPSGISYRQGDIIKAYGGKTIEIGNTDAEGRVILADAIEYAKTKKPALLITIATLTGAAVSALGQRMSALFVKNNKPLEDKLREVGDASGDLVWPLPLWDEHEGDVVGNFADVTNTSKNGGRYGWALLGAAFLSHFAKGVNFAHLDMAPRMTTIAEDELSRGSAGYGVRYFVELAKQWSEIKELLK